MPGHDEETSARTVDITKDKRVMQEEFRMRLSSMEDEIKANIKHMREPEGAIQGFIDQRWLSIGMTHIEQGFMALKRALYEGKRVGDP